MRSKKKIVVAITGASGTIYAKSILKKLASIPEQIEACNIVFSDVNMTDAV